MSDADLKTACRNFVLDHAAPAVPLVKVVQLADSFFNALKAAEKEHSSK